MKVKLIVYLVVTILVIIGLDSININNIFIFHSLIKFVT